ncbi:Uncharacterized protein TCM_015455 isoform 2, partial [Theobroma cacao]
LRRTILAVKSFIHRKNLQVFLLRLSNDLLLPHPRNCHFFATLQPVLSSRQFLFSPCAPTPLAYSELSLVGSTSLSTHSVFFSFLFFTF